MKRLFTFIFILSTFQLLAQINTPVYSPGKIGNLYLQAGKVFHQNQVDGKVNMTDLAGKIKMKELVYSVFNVNVVTATELKGTITNYQMNIEQYGVKRKKTSSFLTRPLNAIFTIENTEGNVKVTVQSIWFSNLPGIHKESHSNIEALITKSPGTSFSKKKKVRRSIALVDRNLEELFKSAILGVKRDS